MSAFIEKITRYFDMGAQFMVAATMLVTSANVIMRQVFEAPIKGAVEFVQLLTGLAVGLGVAYCAFHGGHVAVTFLTDKFPKKMQRIVSIFIDLLVGVFLALSAWQLFIYGENMRIKGEVSLTTGIAVYPLVYVIALGFVLYFLVAVLDITKTLRSLFGKENADNGSNAEDELELENLIN